MIALSEVSFGYGDAPVLRDVAAQASVLTITGPNGSGKTTLLKLILGLLEPSGGTVSAPARKSAVFQDDRLIQHLTAFGNVRIAYPGKVANGPIAAEFEAVGLAEEAWRRPVRELSGGQRRRVCLVRALLPNSELVCLDEPFTGIDAESLSAVRTYVRDRLGARDMALVTHNDDDLAFFHGTRLRLG
ncbi:MAG: ATP-binding cassette domain-containing protein [Propionibacteriaceae bacterium]|jgi:NitT/TauT family transport system ATP-binding protein|nr:ATP-binding cassette domain-containing protein [Propionibacteriaceae bacterium]